MKRTKNFFIALLGFCLMGSGVMAQSIAYYSNGTTAMAYVLPFNPPTGDVVILDTYEGVPVTEISGFNGYKDITSVKLPSTIVSLPASAFSGCSSLASINLGNVIEIGDYAFSGCENLENVSLDNVTNIGTSAFQGCEKMASSLNLSNVVSIGASAFQNCKNITSLTIGNPTLGTDAFRNAPVSTLNFVNVTTIPAGIATQFASTLTKVTFPETAKSISIAASAFSGCTGLKSESVDLSNVTSIGASAFSGCTGLESVDLSNVTSIGSSAFEGCGNYAAKKGLQEVIWSNTVTIIPDNVFNGCSMLSIVNGLFEVATEIGDYAFYNTSSLSGTVTFSEKLTSVGEGAFASSNVSTFVFNSDPSREAADAFVATAKKTLNINDNKLYSTVNTYDNVVYSRSKNGTYGALVLPFDFKKGTNTYYTFTSYDDKGMHFTEVEDNELKADTPYLYSGPDKEFYSSGAYTTKALVDVTGDAPDGWTSNGVYKDYSVDPITTDGYMWAIQGGELKWFKSLKIKPYRAYWQTDNSNVSQNARVFVHTRDGNVTSINMAEIDGLENMVPVYYDLTGRMVNNPVKGNIYIVNGKKVVF